MKEHRLSKEELRILRSWYITMQTFHKPTVGQEDVDLATKLDLENAEPRTKRPRKINDK